MAVTLDPQNRPDVCTTVEKKYRIEWRKTEAPAICMDYPHQKIRFHYQFNHLQHLMLVCELIQHMFEYTSIYLFDMVTAYQSICARDFNRFLNNKSHNNVIAVDHERHKFCGTPFITISEMF